jgi:parallel beta-helix repeat protein
LNGSRALDIESGLTFGTAGATPAAGDWSAANVGTEVALFDRNTGTWYIDRNGDHRAVGAGEVLVFDGVTLTPDLRGTVPVAGDWNGDGVVNMANFNLDTRQWTMDLNGDFDFSDAGETGVIFGIRQALAVSGNWDPDGTGIFTADGDDDIGFFDSTTAQWGLDLNGDRVIGANETGITFGQPGNIPVVGDWDGDGDSDLAAYDLATDRWTVDLNGNRLVDAGETGIAFGTANTIPIRGNWDGDTDDDLGAYDPTTGTFFFDFNGNRLIDLPAERTQFGPSGPVAGVPIIGDWNGDGRDDFGLRDPDLSSRIVNRALYKLLTGPFDVSSAMTVFRYLPSVASCRPEDTGGCLTIDLTTLRDGPYTFQADATTSPTPPALQDEAGNLVDAEFTGSPGPAGYLFGFPTGDGILNDDDLIVPPSVVNQSGVVVPDVVPPHVIAPFSILTRRVIVKFDEPMQPSSLRDFSAGVNQTVFLERAGGDNCFGFTTDICPGPNSAADVNLQFTGTYDPVNLTYVLDIPLTVLLPTDLYRVRIKDDSTVTTNLVGANNDLTYTLAGRQAATIEYRHPGVGNSSLSVTVVANGITVNLATGPGPSAVITSTANDIRNFINSSGTLGAVAARALVNVSLAAGNNGNGLVTTMSPIGFNTATDVSANRIDGEHQGPPPGGNCNVGCGLFPSGDGTAGGFFERHFLSFISEYFVDVTDTVPDNLSVPPPGTIDNPFDTIQGAIFAANLSVKFDQVTVVVLGNNRDPDGAGPGTHTAYQIGAGTPERIAPAQQVGLEFRPLARACAGGVCTASSTPAPVTIKLLHSMFDIAATDSLLATNSTGGLDGLGNPLVTLTSLHDDSIAGDTNGDGTLTAPAKEDWAGILLRSPANTEASFIEFTSFRYGGGKFDHPSFGLSAFSPVHLLDARPSIDGDVFDRNAQAAIAADLASFSTSASPTGPNIGVNTYNDSSINGVLVVIQPGERLTKSIEFNDTNVVHVITQLLDMTDPSAVTMTVKAGVKLKLSSTAIRVGPGDTFSAVGTVFNPVVFTSTRDDSVGAGLTITGATQFDTNNDVAATAPAPGNWGGIEFLAGSNGLIDQAILGFGGGTVPSTPTPRFINMVDVASGALVSIRNSDIHDILGPGVFVTSAAPTIFNNQIRNLIADPNNANRIPAAISVSLDSLGDGPNDPNPAVHVGNAYVRNNLISNTLLQNPANPMISGMDVRSGNLVTPGRWDDDDIAHVVRGLLQVSAPAGRLVIQPGVVVKLLGPTAGIQVNSDAPLARPSLQIGAHDGDPTTCNSQATPLCVEPRVVFTSFADDNTIVRGTYLGTDGTAGDTGLFNANFETGPSFSDGFTVDNSGPDGLFGTPDDGLWGSTTIRGTDPGHSGIHSYYYGRCAGGGPVCPVGSYNTGTASRGVLISPPVALNTITRPVSLSFNYFLQTDASGDVAEVLARRDAASPFTVVGTLSNTGLFFRSQQFDITPFVGTATQIALRFSADGINDYLEGFFVDDVRIATGVDQPFAIGNTNNDVAAPAAGDWNGIVINRSTNDLPGTGSFISNAEFRFANTAVTIDGLPQTGPLISGNASVPQGQLVVRDSLFAANLQFGIDISPGAVPPGGQRLLPGASIVNNVFVGNLGIGLSIRGFAAGGNPVPSVEVLNNTFHNNNFGVSVTSNAGPTLMNNIFSQHTITAVAIDASSNGLRASGLGPVLAFNLFAAAPFANTNDVTIAGAPVAPGTIDSGVVTGNPGYTNVSLAYNAATALARDFQLTRISAAVDAARSDLPGRFDAQRSAIGLPPQSILAPTRDHREEFRIDDPSKPNLGAGTNPFFDIGAFEVTDFASPQVPLITFRLVPAPITPLGDTGIQADDKTNQTRPGFEGFVTDNTGDVANLRVCIDVDGLDLPPLSNPPDRFDDGCTFTDATGFFRLAPTTSIPNTAARVITVRAIDRSGNTGTQSRTIEVDLIPPTVNTIGPLSPLSNPSTVPPQTNVAVTNADVTFSERINVATFDPLDLTLLRDPDGPGPIPPTNLTLSGLTIVRDGAVQTLYHIGIPASLTTAEGTYTLTVNGAGIQDEAGNGGSGTVATSWIMDTTAPVPPVISAITTDTGVSASDRITFDRTLLISGTAEALSTVRVSEAGLGLLGTANTNAAGNWTFDFTGTTLAAGTYNLTFSATATDRAINTSGPSAAFVVRIDTDAPIAPALPDLCSALGSGCFELSDTGSSATDNITRDNTPSFTGTIVDAQLDRVEVFDGVTLLGTATLSGTAPNLGWAFTSSVLADGTHNISARGVDVAGNLGASSLSLPVTIDTLIGQPAQADLCSAIGPNCVEASDTGISTTDNITRDNTPTLNGTAEAGSTVQVISNLAGTIGTTVAVGGSWSLTSPLLADGQHSITVRATDVAGNVSSLSVPLLVTIDTVVSVPGAPDLCSIISALCIEVSDTGVSNTDDITNDVTPTFSGLAGSVEPSSDVLVFSDINGSLGNAMAGTSGAWSLTSGVVLNSNATANGTVHSIRVIATDVAGNVSLPSPQLTIRVDTVPPTTAPSTPDLCSVVAADCPENSDSGFSATDNYTNDTTPSFRGTAEPNGIIRLFDAVQSLGTAPVSAAGVWSLTSGALTQGQHSISATVTDIAGNQTSPSGSLVITIDTTVNPPSTPDLTSDSANANDNITNTNGSAARPISFAGTAEAGGSVQVFAGVTSLGTVSVGNDASDGVTGNGLGAWTLTNSTANLSDGNYAVTATVTDLAGNVSSSSLGLAVVIDTVVVSPSTPDLDAASDSGSLNTDNVTNDDTPTFSGTAEVAATLELREGATVLASVPVGDDASDGILGNGMGTWSATSLAIPCALNIGCAHDISAVVTDVAGNVSGPSAALRITIDQIALPPATPDLDPASDLGSSNSDNVTRDTTPTFTSANNAAEPLGNITVFAGSLSLGTVPVNAQGAWQLTATAPLPDGIHSITARVTDLAGNQSGPSNALSITIDNTPPSPPSQPDLTAATDSGTLNTDNLTNFNGAPGKQPVFTGLAEPFSAVQLFSSATGPSCGSGLPSTLGTTQANAAGNWSVTVGTLLSDGVHGISARLTDLAGNLGACGSSLNVTIDSTAPPAPPTIDMNVGSDTGRRNDDNVTSVNRPRFDGTGAAANTTLTLRANATQIGTASITGTGVWSIVAPTLSDGIYVVTATLTDAAGNESAPATLTPNLVIDTVAPAAPGLPDLDPASDSGILNSDNITNDSTPTFTSLAGDVEGNAQVTIFDGGTALNPTTPVLADGAGRWTFTASVLPDGPHSITARATDVAGNVSGFSLALGLTIDTLTIKPVIQTISDDTGRSASDKVTSDTTLIIAGTAEAGSQVTLRENFVGGGSTVLGSATADANGAWSVNAPPLSEGTHNLTAQYIDLAGNTSAVSDTVVVIIDLTAPSIGGAVTLLSTGTPSTTDDTGIQGDNITARKRPHLVGTATRNHFVDILDSFGAVVGSGVSDATSDTYTVQFASDLADGVYTVRVRASDPAGNFAISNPFTFTVDATPPQVLSVTPSGTQNAAASQIVVQFNNDDLNDRAASDPAFGGSVINPANYTLSGAGFDANFSNGNERAISLTNSQFSYDRGTDRLTINLRDAQGNPVTLTNDSYRLVMDGTVSALDTSSVQDVAGNSIDGNRDNVAGGDFVHGFVIAVPPATIENIRLNGTSRAITEIFLFFSQPLDRNTAQNLSNYKLEDAGRDRNFSTTNDNIVIGLLTPQYDANLRRVALRFNRGISHDTNFQLTVHGTVPTGGGVNDAVRDFSGNLMDGDFNGIAGGDNISYLLRGKKASYRDGDGDLIDLQLSKGGLMELVRFANGEGRFLTLTGTGNRSALKGTVTQKPGADGLTHFVRVAGSGGVNLTNFPRPPFVVSNPIAAAVVDRLLDSGESASDLLADSIAHGTHHKK